MSVVRRTWCFVSAAWLLAAPALPQTPAAQARSELRALGNSLDGAVRRVSRASAQALGSSTRSYLVPGLGVVFILAPRSLPSGAPRPADSPALTALLDASRRIEQSLKSVHSAEERARLERSLQTLRESQDELRRSSGFALQLRTGPEGEVTLQSLTLGPDGAGVAEAHQLLDPAEQELRLEMGRQFGDLLAQAERFRSNAAKAQAEAEQQLWQRLQGRGEAPAAPSPPPAPPAPLEPAEAPLAPPPPWEVFFDFGEPEDTRAPEVVIQAVRQAVVTTLAVQGGRLSGLRPEEQVVVAVDFLPAFRTARRAGPERTLVIRVPKKDLDELKASRLSSQDFRKRVQVSEY